MEMGIPAEGSLPHGLVPNNSNDAQHFKLSGGSLARLQQVQAEQSRAEIELPVSCSG